MTSLSVLSVNVYMMGHAAYQLGLERGFAQHVPEIDFRSVRLSEVNRSDLGGRIAYWMLTRRVPGLGNRDYDWIRLRSELAASLFLRRALTRLLPAVSPDVLHVHTQSIGLLSTDIFRKVPTVVSMDCTSALLARIHPPPAQRTYGPLVRLERRCLHAAAHVVCWSNTVRRSVVEDYGVDTRRVTIIRPTVPQQRFSDGVQPGKPRSKLRLLFVGNDFIRKGGADVVAVFREQLQASCELDIVTNATWDVPHLEGLRVHRGITPFSDPLMHLYAEADLFVMPSYDEAFGLVYLEAMAAGLPCIGSDVLAVPELVRDGITGLTVRAGDRRGLLAAIERLRDDPPLRAQLGAAGREFALRECDIATNCKQLAEVFTDCVAHRRVRALADAS